jgi:mycothiol synthase
MNYTQRFYEGETDYAAMRRLIADSYKLAAPHSYMLLGDLDWWRALLAEPEAFLPTIPLWFADDTLVGFVWPREGNGELFTHPHHRAVEEHMVAYAEQHLRTPATAAKPAALTLVSLQSDTRRNELLTACGLVRMDSFLASHILDLSQPTPTPQLPEGFTIRDMTGALSAAEIEARVNVHRAAFHPSKFTAAKYALTRSSPTFRPDLDLVAVAPNGDFAAYCTLWFEPENRVALYEPVGCHPDYQRRGLGRAVLHEGALRLRELGAVRAHVGSWREDSAGAMLYRAAGFQLIDRFYDWRKIYPVADPATDTTKGAP